MGLSSIAGALFSSSAAAPSVRRPAFEAQFGNGAASDWAQALVAFSVELGAAPFVDCAVLDSSAARGPAAAPGDAGTIKAGYEDSSTDLIFTGKVDAARVSLDGVLRVSASTGAGLLAGLRVDQSYEQSTAGDIVNDLAKRVAVDTDSIEEGATYPFYAVDARQNAWQHIATLARQNGFRAFFSTEGKLNFKPVAAGEPVASLAYGSDVLAVELWNARPAAGKVAVTGEGAAGSNGADAWNWLLKDPSAVRAESGGDDPAKLVTDPALRSADSAQTAANALAGAIGSAALSGCVWTPGVAAVTFGSAIEITGAPQSALNGVCLVERVRHRFNKREGFTSRIYFTQTGPAGGGAGGLLDAAKGLL
jgi:phage protein D